MYYVCDFTALWFIFILVFINKWNLNALSCCALLAVFWHSYHRNHRDLGSWRGLRASLLSTNYGPRTKETPSWGYKEPFPSKGYMTSLGTWLAVNYISYPFHAIRTGEPVLRSLGILCMCIVELLSWSNVLCAEGEFQHMCRVVQVDLDSWW